MDWKTAIWRGHFSTLASIVDLINAALARKGAP